MKQAQRRSMAWKMPSVSAQGLKIFACVTLILGSIGMIIFEKGIINVEQYKANELNDLLAGNSALMGQVGMTVALGFIGGLALPIIAFLLTEGFFNTSSYMKYLCAVFAFALISEIPYDFAMTGKVLKPESDVFYGIVSGYDVFFQDDRQNGQIRVSINKVRYHAVRDLLDSNSALILWIKHGFTGIGILSVP